MGEISILKDGQSVQVIAKLSYGILLCWVNRGSYDETVEMLTILDLYERSNIVQTRPEEELHHFEPN